MPRWGTSYNLIPTYWTVRRADGKVVGDVHLWGKRYEARGRDRMLGTYASAAGAARRLLREAARQELEPEP